MSRAKERLTLCHVVSEAGGAEAQPSRFLRELPSELVQHTQAYY